MQKKGGGYIDVPYIDGAVLVNLGALMQQWTGDKYPATVIITLLMSLIPVVPMILFVECSILEP